MSYRFNDESIVAAYCRGKWFLIEDNADIAEFFRMRGMAIMIAVSMLRSMQELLIAFHFTSTLRQESMAIRLRR
jgi:hypothetical protein